MATKIKRHICKTMIDHFSRLQASEKQATQLAADICVGRQYDDATEFYLPLKSIMERFSLVSPQSILKKSSLIAPDDLISSVSLSHSVGKKKLIFTVPRHVFIRSTLEDICWRERVPSNGMSVVLDFSSPNIAKPFHMGHLRSTVIGNFLSNLHEFFGYKVVRLNYLGDWGTQFGLIKIGMEMLNPSPHELSKNPLHILFQAYVLANKAAENDISIMENARKCFCNLERGEKDGMNDWESFRGFTVSELQRTYKRLGITFTDYSWESDYRASNLPPIIELLKAKGLITIDEEGRTICKLPNGERVPLLKSDGTTLYLIRDIAAAIDRFSKYQFSKMFYVVDSSQSSHFGKLFSILQCLGGSWSEKLEHISFGRVRGMSTRKGEATFLSDILDHSQQIMAKRQTLSPNTRVSGESSADVSDVLGVSAVIIADLRHSRNKAYTFNWNDAVNPQGDTGVRLQYTHCRLCSLEDRCGLSPASSCDPNALSEPIAYELVYEISRFDDVLKRTYETLEASVLTSYLFNLCSVINRAFLQLRVKGSEELGPQRLLLFQEARFVLNQGMRILGLTPLEKM